MRSRREGGEGCSAIVLGWRRVSTPFVDMKIRYTNLILCALAVIPLADAFATDSFRCGTHVISQGLAQHELVQYCGEPAEKHGDTWIYDWGPERQTMVVHFDMDLKIDRIQAQQ